MKPILGIMETSFYVFSLLAIYVILMSYYLFYRKNGKDVMGSITSKNIKEDSEVMVLARPTIINFVILKESEAILTSELMADFTINFNEILDGSYLKKESFEKLKKRFDYSAQSFMGVNEVTKNDASTPINENSELDVPQNEPIDNEGDDVVFDSYGASVYDEYEQELPPDSIQDEDVSEDPLNTYVNVEI